MELDKLIAEEKELEYKLISNEGEITEEDSELKEELERSIENEVIKYAWFLTNKGFKSTIERLKEHKKAIDTQVKRLEAIEGIIKSKLAIVLEEKGPIPIDVQGIKKEIKVGYTKRRSIEGEVEEPYGKYIITLTGKQYEELYDVLKDNNVTDIVHKVGVTDLPENHKAIRVKLNPQIKIVNRR